MAVLALGIQTANSAIIVNVVETGGDNEATDTITAKWTGQTWNATVAGEPIPGITVGTPYTAVNFGNYVPTFVDRNHRYTGHSDLTAGSIPPYLLNAEYILSGNDNRDNASYRLDVTVSVPVTVYMLIDNRLQDGDNATPPTFGAANMQWILDEGWAATTNGFNRTSNPARPDELGIDEGADDGINQWYSVYTRSFPAGTFQLKQADNASRNMYGVVVAPSTIVGPPEVPAGLTEFSQDSRVTLQWTAATGAETYIIKRATVSGGPYTSIGTNMLLTFVDTTVVNGTVYYYVVSGLNSAGESGNSAEVMAQPNIAPVVTAIGGTNQVSLTWTSLAGATGYGVYRSDTDGGPYGLVAGGIGSPSFVDTAVVGGRRYYYVVAGTLAGGVPGGFSLQVQAITAPSDFTNAVAELFAATVAKVAFRRADQVVATVQIERSSDGVNFAFWTNITANAGYALEAGLAPMTTKYYRLRASNVTGFSSYGIGSVTTPSGGYDVNFATGADNSAGNPVAPIPPGFVQDIGDLFGDRGNGWFYGWNNPSGTNITRDARYRQNANSADLRYDTFNHLQKGYGAGATNNVWEIQIPNGLYVVRVAAGDPTAVDSIFQFEIEGTFTRSYVPVAGAWWADFTNTVMVSDGRLTITSGTNSSNNKLNFAMIHAAVPTPNPILEQPQSVTVPLNRTVTFSVVLGGGPEPFTLQWYHGDNPIPGANGLSHVIQYAQPENAGEYHVTVSNAGASTNSATATLTVLPDTEGPRLVSVGSVDGNTIGVCFDEYVESDSATDAFVYSVNDGAVEVSGAELRPDGRSVRLFLGLGAPIAGPFTVAAGSVLDLAGNGDGLTTFATNTVMGLTAEDVGSPVSTVLGTNYTCDSDVVELTGGGADIWNAADQFYLASKSVSGDFDARVRVLDLRGTHNITKAALMVRETAAAGSRTLHLSVNPVPPGRDQFQPGVRSVTDGTYVYWGTNYVPAGIPNCWLRITRSGDDFKGYRSTNGVDWILLAETNQVYSESVLVGLGVTSHDDTTFAIGTFQGFSVGPISNPPTAPLLLNPLYSAGAFSFGITTESGRSYQVLYKDQLDAATWTPLTTVPGTGGLVPVTDPGPLPSTRFYRVLAQ